MNKIFLSAITIFSLVSSCYAAETTSIQVDSAFPRIHWQSRSPNEIVTIENGTGMQISVTIWVDNPGTRNPPGINLKNCGKTDHVRAGSAVICWTNDDANPITFNSDSGEFPASGTYQIKPTPLL